MFSNMSMLGFIIFSAVCLLVLGAMFSSAMPRKKDNKDELDLFGSILTLKTSILICALIWLTFYATFVERRKDQLIQFDNRHLITYRTKDNNIEQKLFWPLAVNSSIEVFYDAESKEAQYAEYKMSLDCYKDVRIHLVESK